MIAAKPFIIPKSLISKAFEFVKKNKGSAGVDKESIDEFEKNLKDNLFKIWNRMSSGNYFPLSKRNPKLFAHWRSGMIGAFA